MNNSQQPNVNRDGCFKRKIETRSCRPGTDATISFAILAAFIISMSVLTWNFVQSERTIYIWDFHGYWAKAVQLTEIILASPRRAISHIIYSMRYETYNSSPVIPVSLMMAIFGSTTRACYVVTVLICSGLTSLLFTILASRRISRIWGAEISLIWSTVAAIAAFLLMPGFFQPIFRGFPDAIGVVFCLLVLALYFGHEDAIMPVKQAIILGFLMGVMMTLRRWYAYWVISFYLLYFLELAASIAFRKNYSAPQLFNYFAPIAASFGILLIVVVLLQGPIFLSNLKTNFSDIYSAYRFTGDYFNSMITLAHKLGGLALILSVAAMITFFRNRKARRLALFLPAHALLTSYLFLKTADHGMQHVHLYHASMAFTLTLFLGMLIDQTKRLYLKIGLGFFFVIVGLVSFSVGHSVRAKSLKAKLSYIISTQDVYPLVRDDIDEFRKMAHLIREISTTSKEARIYVLSSNGTLSDYHFFSMGLSLNMPDVKPQVILRSKHVDKRDGFPSELLKADYVFVADPPQFHLRKEDQRVIGIPAEIFIKGEGIARSFEKSESEFDLEGNVKVLVFKRIREIPKEDIDDLSDRLKKWYPDRPELYTFKPN